MPYPAAHGYLTILGDSFGQQEEWQTGIRLTGTVPPTLPEMEAIDAAVTTFLSTEDLQFPNAFRYTSLKWAPQTTAGRYPDGQDAVEYLRPAPLVGSYTDGYPQIAVVLSLRTARTRGYASNGRMYIPSARKPSASTGQIPEANAIGIATAAATLVGAIADAGVGVPSVMSTVGAGASQPITGVRIGRVMDTQRRRRGNLPEGYTEAVAVPS